MTIQEIKHLADLREKYLMLITKFHVREAHHLGKFTTGMCHDFRHYYSENGFEITQTETSAKATYKDLATTLSTKEGRRLNFARTFKLEMESAYHKTNLGLTVSIANVMPFGDMPSDVHSLKKGIVALENTIENSEADVVDCYILVTERSAPRSLMLVIKPYNNIVDIIEDYTAQIGGV